MLSNYGIILYMENPKVYSDTLLVLGGEVNTPADIDK